MLFLLYVTKKLNLVTTSRAARSTMAKTPFLAVTKYEEKSVHESKSSRRPLLTEFVFAVA